LINNLEIFYKDNHTIGRWGQPPHPLHLLEVRGSWWTLSNAWLLQHVLLKFSNWHASFMALWKYNCLFFLSDTKNAAFCNSYHLWFDDM
jgi:hypothetical protein